MRILFIISVCFLASEAFAQSIPSNPNQLSSGKRQGKWTVLIDKDWKEITSPSAATYYRIIEYNQGVPQGITRDYFVSGNVQFEGHLLSENPDVNDGLCVWYLENGNKSKESNYKNGALDGKYINYRLGKIYSEGTYANGKLAIDWLYFGDDYTSYYQTGNQLREIKEFARAEDNFLKAKNAAIKEFGPKSYQLRNVYWSLTYLYQDDLQPQKAEIAYNNAWDVHRALRGNKDVDKDFVVFTEGIGKFLMENDLRKAAIKNFRIAAAERKRNQLLDGWGYYWDLKYTLDNYYALNVNDSIDHYFSMIAPLVEKEEEAYISHLTDWTSYLISQDAYDKFDPVAKRLEKYLLGKTQKDIFTARALISYGKIMWLTGQAQRAIKSYTDAREILEPVKDANKRLYVDVYYYVARLYNKGKKYDAAADRWFSEYEKLNEQWAADLGTRYRDGLVELMSYSLNKKDYIKAEALTRKTIAVFEKANLTEDPDYKMLPVILAGILEKQGRNAESQAIVKTISKGDEQNIIKSIGLDEALVKTEELGKYLHNGEFLKAIRIFELYADMVNSVYIKNNDYNSVVSTMLAVSLCYRETGDFARAEELLLAANKIAEEKLSKGDESSVLALWNTGDFYQSTGSSALAERYYRNALVALNDTRTEKNKKENDEQYYNVLARLASVYKDWGDYDEAEKLYFKALDYKYDAYGKNSSEYATVNLALGELYHSMHLYAIAEKIYNEVEPIYKKLGTESERYMSLLRAMSINYQVRGEYSKAEPMFLKLKDYYARTVGVKSNAYAAVLTDIAIFYYHSKQWAKAAAAYDELNQLSIYKIDNFFNSLSEKEKSIFYTGLQRNFNKFNSFAIHDVVKTPSIAGKMYDLQLATKGLLFRSTNRVKETILTGKDDSLKAQYQRWMTRKEMLSKVYGMSDAEKKKAGIDEKSMETSVNQLEKELTKKSAEFATLIAARPDWRQIQKKLKPGEAAVEMVRVKDAIPAYKFYYFGKGLSYDSVKNDFATVNEIYSDRTAAFRAGIKEGDIIQEINGQSTKGKTMDQIANLMEVNPTKMKLIRKGTTTVYMATLSSDSVFTRTYANPAIYAALILTPETINNPEVVLLNNGDMLESRYLNYYRNAIRAKIDDRYSYDMFWRPIREKLKASKTIYFSSDGIYNSINLNTLYNPASGKYVLDELEIRLVSNTSDILTERSPGGATQIVLIGFPDYNKTSTAAKSNLPDATDFLILKSDTSQRFMNGSNVSELPGTQVEVNSIEKVFQGGKSTVSKWVSLQASEDNLKKIHSPKILHIATHGFFMDDIPANATERGITGVSIGKLRENPLLRSGLLLAGAGKTITSGKESGETEDGILTAYEAMNLDLQKTELVVLSACETGLGQVRAGEGVYGLQRAFRSAGAQSVLMSLWKVDDQATQELMTEFYKQWQMNGMRQASFHDAQMKLRTKFAHPYYWGAFVMVGN